MGMSENICERTVEHWRRVLRAALRDAMRGRQLHAMAVLRDTLAAIDNAEAVAVGEAPPALEDGVIAGAAAGLGAGEVPRRVLSAEVVTAIVARVRRGPAPGWNFRLCGGRETCPKRVRHPAARVRPGSPHQVGFLARTRNLVRASRRPARELCYARDGQ